MFNLNSAIIPAPLLQSVENLPGLLKITTRCQLPSQSMTFLLHLSSYVYNRLETYIFIILCTWCIEEYDTVRTTPLKT